MTTYQSAIYFTVYESHIEVYSYALTPKTQRAKIATQMYLGKYATWPEAMVFVRAALAITTRFHVVMSIEC